MKKVEKCQEKVFIDEERSNIINSKYYLLGSEL